MARATHSTDVHIHAERFAELISRNKPKIVETWTNRVRDRIPRARLGDPKALIGFLPDDLDQIVGLFSHDSSDRSDSSDVRLKIAREHGATRVSLNYAVRDVANEYSILNEVLIELGTAHGTLDPSLIISLNRLSHDGMINAVEEFLERRDSQPEREARSLIDTSPAMLWITDEESNCVFLSRQWYEFTGRTPAQDLGRGWLENVHPDDLAETSRVYTQAVSNKGSLRVDYRLRSKDGSYRWFMDIGFPRFDREKKFSGYIGTMTDIEDRVVIAQKLQQSQERFDRSTRATDLGIWYCDLPFAKLNWNLETKKHFFLPPDADVDIDLFYERIHPEDREMTRTAIKNSNDHKAPYDIIYRTTNPNSPGEVKSIRALGWTDYNSNGEPVRFDGITLDVTSQIKVNQQLQEAKSAAEKANDAKSAFLANMSHEIRTPLGAIMGFADLAQQAGTSIVELQSYLEVVERNSGQVLRIIDDILDLAKVESGRVELERIHFSLLEFLADCSSLMGFRAREKGIQFKLVADSDLPDAVISDPTRLRQILTNAVGNAIKFTTKGSVALHVSAMGPQLTFRVVDTGRGISSEQSRHLFQAFVQADVSTTRKFGGTGLGLVLTRSLCQLMDGDYVLEWSELGRGSTFTATLVVEFPKPVQFVAQDEIVFQSEKNKRVATVERKLDGVRVLLVEDSLDNQQLVKLILGRTGALIDIASDGSEGVKRALENDYDIVFMDIQMPIMDGHEAIRKLRSLGYSKPVVALTAHAMKEEMERAQRSGFTSYLTKPIQREALTSMVSDLASASSEA